MADDDPGEVERADELEQLRHRNAGHMQRLALSGVQVNLMPQLLDTLIEHVFVSDEAKRVFQLDWERRASAMLEQIDREVRLAQLRAPGGPVHTPNGHG